MVVYRVIGHPTARADGLEKVTGKALYTADVKLPDTLWGKVLRSPFPHARITSVDSSRSAEVPGVHCVLTGSDVQGVLYGRRLRDIPVLAHERVRFVGEPVAAVAAIDEDIAQRALDLIDIEYEELPPVFDPLEALASDAPVLHPEVNTYAGLPEPVAKSSNAFATNTWGKGDPNEAFSLTDVVVENTFTTPQVHQAYLEPHSCAVWIDEQDVVQVWASNKAPYALRQQLSDALGIPEERIQLNHSYIGGDFGGKGSPLNVPLCYFLALNTGRPVKIVMDYVEEFMAANPRHAAIIRLKTGVKQDGTLLAHRAQITFNSGAYGGFKPGVNLHGGSAAAGAYKIPHVHIEAVQVYTNTVPCGHMRSPGEPQALFALESQIDIIARQLGIDPLEFRLKNLLERGDESAIGIRYKDIRAKETLRAATEAAEYHALKPLNVGRGMAIGDREAGGGESHSAVTLNPDGSIILSTPIFEQGTGSYTMLRQIVAEELGVSAEKVGLEMWNTGTVPFDSGVGGSRVTRIAVPAAYQAARRARDEVMRLAAEVLGWPREYIEFSGEEITHRDTEETRRWDDVLSEAGQAVTGRGAHADSGRTSITSFTAQVAEVSVDPETGEVKLLRLTTSHDIGRILNPIGHQGQINGAVLQGVGYALMEELEVEEGQVTTLSFGDYKIPTINDIPELQTVLLESNTGTGAYRTKGIGENPISPVAAAIANAVEDAVGVRIRDLPVTAEKVYRALNN